MTNSIHTETTYYPNGLPRCKQTFIDGRLHGQAISWHSNGQIAVLGYFLDGLPHGMFIERDRKGILELETFYRHGMEISRGAPLRAAS